MIDGWYWFTIPLIIPALVGVALAATWFLPNLLPPTALRPRDGDGSWVWRSWLARIAICAFVGTLVVGVGFGSIFPVINRVAAPFACGDRRLDLQTSTWTAPGETRTTLHWSCVDDA